MIGRSRADGRGDARPAARTEFVGVDARLQAVRLRRLENPLRLVRREHARLAEDVAPFREPLARDGGNHLAHQQVDVVAAAPAVLGRDLVSAHERGRQLDGVISGQRANHPQHFQLAFGRQPVPALGFARGDATAQHLVEAATGVGGQLIVGRCAGRDDGSENAAAFGCDLRVGRARQAPPQLLAAVAGEDDVRVGVHEARHDRASTRVEHHGISFQLDLALQEAFEADEDDPPSARSDGRTRNRSRIALCGASPRRGTGARQNVGCVADQEIG